jgi:hypothetical protein
MDADIRNWPREEDYIIYLARRRVGDPIPQGVFPENPFSSHPWEFSSKLLILAHILSELIRKTICGLVLFKV